MAARPAEALARLPQYNSDFYDANANPFGLADFGHVINFPLALGDFTVTVNYVGELTAEVEAFARLTADDRRQTGVDREAARLSAAEAAKFDPAGFVKRDGSQAMTSLLRLAASTANNGSLIIPAGIATPTGAALADGVVWGDGNNIIWRLGGTSRVARDSRPGSIPNANLGDMLAATVKMRRPGTGTGAPVDATLAQLISDLGFLSDLSERGYQQLPGGLYTQWGFSASSEGADYRHTFPKTFPNNCFCVVCSSSSIPPSNYAYVVSADSWNRDGVAFRKRALIGAQGVTATADAVVIRYWAIGF